jgi:hypothetical protein
MEPLEYLRIWWPSPQHSALIFLTADDGLHVALIAKPKHHNAIGGHADNHYNKMYNLIIFKNNLINLENVNKRISINLTIQTKFILNLKLFLDNLAKIKI